MSLFLMILAVTVVCLLAARSIKVGKQRSSGAAKSATRDKKRGRAKKYGLDPLSSSELNFENKAQPDALHADHSLAAEEEVAEGEKPSPLVVIHLFAAKDRPYQGYELLQTLLANNLRHGERQIFHCYEGKGKGAAPLFSVTSLNKPGTFDLPKMGEFSCDGLILFSQLDQVKDPQLAARSILEAAKAIADNLGGELADEQRCALTDEFALRLAQQAGFYAKQQATLV